jgi:hypothetical protein
MEIFIVELGSLDVSTWKKMMPLIDNQEENVASFLHKHLQEDSSLRLVSAYFAIYAYAGLRDHLEQLKSVRFLLFHK